MNGIGGMGGGFMNPASLFGGGMSDAQVQAQQMQMQRENNMQKAALMQEQQKIQAETEMVSHISNVLKKMHDANMAIINNLR